MRARTEICRTKRVKIGDSHRFSAEDGRVFVIEVDSIDLTGPRQRIDGEVVRVFLGGGNGRPFGGTYVPGLREHSSEGVQSLRVQESTLQ